MIRGKQFVDVRFEQQDVEGEQFSECRFIGCNFSWLDQSDSRFIDCSFYDRESERGSLLQGCDLREASFLRCDLTMADCSRSLCLGLDLRRVDLQGVQINEDQQQTLLEQIGLVVFP
ncbi:pentapeptide repeat-containing protein [Aeromonas veronii]